MISRELLLLRAIDHGPRAWNQLLPGDRFFEIVERGLPITAVVVSADVRASTSLMRESLDVLRFADIVSGFVTQVQRHLQERTHGWFDKFLGDGFLAYWPMETLAPEDLATEVAGFCNLCVTAFRERVMPDLRLVTANFPARVGLSIGVDAGTIHLVPVE